MIRQFSYTPSRNVRVMDIGSTKMFSGSVTGFVPPPLWSPSGSENCS